MGTLGIGSRMLLDDPIAAKQLRLDGPELERTLEAAECLLYADLYAALPRPLARRHGIRLERRGPELRFTASAIDHPFFNRVMGIGLVPGRLHAPGPAWLDRHARHYEDAGIRRWMLQLLPQVQTPALQHALEARGLVALRGWAKHLGPSVPGPTAATDLVVREVDARTLDAWVAICAEGFGVPAELAPWFASLHGRAGWRLYVACEDAEPVACAALHHAGRLATLTFAATRAAARRRGAQTALIKRRLRDARALGCPHVLSETDEPLPETPNPSTNNLVRLGLDVRYVRANWGPPKPES